ncbi:carotene dioxygenase [Jimgerdemannia flammicorona]|uniref:Carotene dioxygenase n=1 Tax=Jimgerdemannia flammicorona TaxID=994334 RepID=A0A433D9Y5_9FUNG|nr:carotene dioxygenase [Jimgerdemannia flammicorona]
MAPSINVQSNYKDRNNNKGQNTPKTKSVLGKSIGKPTGYKNTPEIPEQVEIRVTGKLPRWLSGVLYRSGTGKFNIPLPDGSMYHIQHPFDGLSLVHRFEFSGSSNTVKYNSRYTAKGVEKRIVERDNTVLFFGPDPCKTVFDKISSFFHHITGMGKMRARQEADPTSEIINVAVTPNFPLPKGDRFDSLSDQGLVVKTDANMVQVLDEVTLAPKKIFTYTDYAPGLNGQLSAAHHQQDPVTGETVNFVVELGPVVQFRAFSVSASGVTTQFEPISQNLADPRATLKAAYVHSFSMTEKYIIIPNYPYWFSYNGMATIWHGSVYESFYWDGTKPTLYQVLDRRTKKHVATYQADAYFAFHTVNAWDEVDEDGDDVIVFDVCAYDSPDIISASFGLGKADEADATNNVKKSMDIERSATAKGHRAWKARKAKKNRRASINFKKDGPFKPFDEKTSYMNQTQEHAPGLDKPPIRPSEVRRYRLENVTKVALAQADKSGVYNKYRHPHADYIIVAEDVELPRIDPRREQRPYRYVWGVCNSVYGKSYANASSTGLVTGIVKADLKLGPSATLKWDKPGCSCSEPIFIPNPSSEQEDVGVILSIVNMTGDGKGRKDSCFLLVLNARDLTEIAKADIGKYNASTFHGSFMDANGNSISVN